LALTFAIGAALSSRWALWWPHLPILAGVGEALMIAAILAFTVDKFVKEHFIYDVSRDVFHYIVGYDVPDEIKLKIKELLQISIVAVHKMIELRIQHKGKTSVAVFVQVEWAVRNLSHLKREYTPRISVLRSDRPVFLRHQVISKTYSYSDDGDTLTKRVLRREDSAVDECVGEPLEIEPYSDVGEFRIRWEYSVTQPKEHYHLDGFGTPTIGLTVRVARPPDIDVDVIGDFKHVGNEWSTDRLFDRGEFVTIQWRPKNA
jgi:hypothetical protein